MQSSEHLRSPEWGERRPGYGVRRRLGSFALSVAGPEAGRTAERIIVPEDYWRERFTAAREFMASREGRPKALIVATAQHPLIDGHEPNEEFATRLAVARNHAHAVRLHGVPVEVYVPGSRQKQDGIALADAGEAWLRANGLPPDVTIHASAANEQYRGDYGVYNSADEALVAAELFKADEDFGELYVVCSPGQAIRWELHAVAMGIAPDMHPVGVSGPMYHDATHEDKLIAYTRFVDPTWQSKASVLGQLTRRMRRP